MAGNESGSAAFLPAQMATHDFDDPDFEQWKREPFLALVMYEQMQQAYGWDPKPAGVRNLQCPTGL